MRAQRRTARRRADLAQHFLRRGALASRLVAQSSITRRDCVVEIGAGRGALTRELGKTGARVLAIEIDTLLCGRLREEFRDRENVDVIEGDFLRQPAPGTPYKIFGNAPFHRTAEIVRRIDGANPPPEDAYLILQREPAERLAGRPYQPESVQSLLLKPRWHVEVAERLRRTDFDPPPSVDCVLLWMARRPRSLIERRDERAYADLVSRAFGCGAARVKDALRARLTRTQIGRLGRDLRFDPGAPPSALTFEQWLGLFRFATRQGEGSRLGTRRARP